MADAEIPLPEYDSLPLGSVQSRIRTLSLPELEAVEQYERAHAGRVAVLGMIEARLTELRNGAEPSGGSPAAPAPEVAPAPAGDTGVSPQTAGPKQNPPSQGVPSNPAQPRPTG